MKYFKILLVGISFVFIFKTFNNVFAISDVQSKVETEKYIDTENVKNVKINVTNANVTLLSSPISDIRVVSKLTNKQIEYFEYIVSEKDGEIKINEYKKDKKKINEYESFGEIEIFVPNEFNLSLIDIKMNNGAINSMVSSKEVVILGNSVAIDIKSTIEKLNIQQKIGVINISDNNIKEAVISVNKGQLNINKVVFDKIDINSLSGIEATFDFVFANEINLLGKYNAINFNVGNKNNIIVNGSQKIKKNTQLILENEVYKYTVENGKNMTINLRNQKINSFIIN